MDRPGATQFFDLEDHMCQYYSLADTEITRNQLYQLDIHKSMRPDGIHARFCNKTLLNVTLCTGRV